MPRILVIEPEPDLAMVLKMILEPAGHQVFVVRAVAGARGLRNWRPDLIVYNLAPGESGPGTCALLRTRWPVAKLLVLHTSLDPALTPMLLAGGADACMLEPFEPDALVAEVSRLLGASPP